MIHMRYRTYRHDDNVYDLRSNLSGTGIQINSIYIRWIDHILAETKSNY